MSVLMKENDTSMLSNGENLFKKWILMFKLATKRGTCLYSYSGVALHVDSSSIECFEDSGIPFQKTAYYSLYILYSLCLWLYSDFMS